MWALVDEGALNGVERLQVGAVTGRAAVYALILDLRDASLAADDVMPVPGCNPQAGGHGRYWLTGTVGDDVRYIKKSKHLPQPSYRFLLTVGNLRFIGKLIASRRQVTIRSGSRLTVECVLAVPHEKEWDADDLPEEWCSAWQILGTATDGQLGYMLDLEPPDDEETNAAGFRRRTRLLLDTDYGGGPLWYRSVDNQAPWGLGLDYFPLSEALHRRLVKWTAGDYHLHYDYEDDDPQHEAAWHAEGLALLADLRAELGPDYDIKFSHDLDA
jgi:hypothetical protein